MDKNEAYEKVKKYADIVRKNFAVRNIVMFGSYVTGVPRADSDIDVAVVVDNITGDFLTFSQCLYKLRRDVDERIEPLLLEKSSDKSGFLASIMRTGKVVA